MKKLKFILPVSLLSIFISGCGNDNALAEYNESPSYEQSVDDETKNNLDNSIFYLNEEEIALYELLKNEMSTSVLENVNPISIAKIHVQAGLDGESEVGHLMFNEVGLQRAIEENETQFDSEDPLLIPAEDVKIVIHSEIYSRLLVDENFAFLDEGTFIEDSENEGRIIFHTKSGDSMSYRLIKNDAGIWEIAFPAVETYTFSLNEEEIEIYELLKEELSTSVLENVSPFSIAKIHIQAGLDGEWEAEHSMFSEVGLQRSLEEWVMYLENERSEIENTIEDFEEYIRIMANDTFSLLENGEFIEDSETEAHIAFENIFGDPMSFRFIKNDTGIWEVSYSPIQFI